jgi:hypothetical protein
MGQRAATVLDVMKVPAHGDPLDAVVAIDHDTTARTVKCEVLVVGGGLGGVAAALAAARCGRHVCLLEETDWIGGQATSQGVAALDEHEHIETFGGTQSYYAVRQAIRDHYRRLAGGELTEPLNPGTCWVTQLAFEPRIAVEVFEDMLARQCDPGRVELFLRTKTTAVETRDDRIEALRAINLDTDEALHFDFEYVLDATELGELLPLGEVEYVVGAESVAQRGEPNAQPAGAKAHCVQSCTYTFAMERRADGENHRIPEPDKYLHYRDAQPYSLRIEVHAGEIYGETSGWLDYHVLDQMPDTKGPLWTYRRLVDAAQFPGHFDHDVSMFNWPGMDYRDQPLVDQDPANLAQVLQDAKRVSLGFAYWLQTEAPNAPGKPGFPALAMRPDVMGSADGLSKFPYIRECRRIKAVRTVVEQDVAIAYQPGPRAAEFDDAVGIGWYPIDIHQAGEGDIGISTRTKPFQIPLGALIPIRVENLIVANKNIGSTHITNGCYRLHPVEWGIGEAAGTLAAMAVQWGQTPKALHADSAQRRTFQHLLIAAGIACAWLIDVPVWSASFEAVQRLVLAGGFGGREDDLAFAPDHTITAADRAKWLLRVAGPDAVDPCGEASISRAEFAEALLDADLI